MKKIMFSDKYGLTKAVLNGRKTMTRRIIPDEFFTLMWDQRDDTLVYENDFGDFIDIRSSNYCRYHVGEEVAVAQSYRDIGLNHPDPDYFLAQIAKAHRVEDVDTELLPGWRNKMFVRADLMPHRIRITDSRVERLQDISDDDCIKEGIMKSFEGWRYGSKIYTYSFREDDFAITSQGAFRGLINAISGRVTWVHNPWVVAYEFELVK